MTGDFFSSNVPRKKEIRFVFRLGRNACSKTILVESQYSNAFSIEWFIFIPKSLFFNKFLVSKETVVLRRWEGSKQKFGFIKGVDKGEITTVKDLESWRFER